MIEERVPKSSRRNIALAIAFAVLTVFSIAGIYRWKTRQKSLFRELLTATSTVDAHPFQTAIQKVEEDRGPETGNKAKVDVPAELKLYKDKKRFLAIQVAAWLEGKYEIPHDFAELAVMISRGEFTRLAPLGSSYILYGVGIKANDELTHYDQKTGQSIPLFSSEVELNNELARLDDSLKELDKQGRDLKNDLARATKSDRAARKEILAHIADARKSVEATKKRKTLIDSFYKSKEHRQLMVNEYAALAELARNFNGKSYDLNDAGSRKEFKISLLSVLRAPAIARLEEIALAYQQKFDRPLPITSLARTKEYQRYLGEAGNPNATRIDVPPHTTGLAFDVYTYYMNAEEQQFLMDEIARLKREGRVEALRENRNHIHVFAFADGHPPSETLIKESFARASLAANGDQ
jgi:hypothetical protein